MSATNPSLDGAILTPEEVRTYLSDSVQDNHLLDSIEFSDNRILLAMKMAISDYNTMSPATMFQGRDFPSLSVLLDGTCYNLFKGQVALSARNQMSYTDGGLTIPIEERYQYYEQLMGFYGQEFQRKAKELKIHMNMENGWNMVHSDYATFPNW